MRLPRPFLVVPLAVAAALGGCFLPPDHGSSQVREREPNDVTPQRVRGSLPIRVTGNASQTDRDRFRFVLPEGPGTVTFTCIPDTTQLSGNIYDVSMNSGAGTGCDAELFGRTTDTDGGEIDLLLIGPPEGTDYVVEVSFTPTP